MLIPNTSESFGKSFYMKKAYSVQTAIRNMDMFSNSFFKIDAESITKNPKLSNFAKFSLVNEALIFEYSHKSFRLATPVSLIFAYVCNFIFGWIFNKKYAEIDLSKQLELLKKEIKEQVPQADKNFAFLSISEKLKQKLCSIIKKSQDTTCQTLALWLLKKTEQAQDSYLAMSTQSQLLIADHFLDFAANKREFAEQKIKENALFLQYFPKFSADEELVKLAFSQNPQSLAYADSSLKKKISFMESLINDNNQAFLYVDSSISLSDVILLKALSKNAQFLKILPLSYLHQKKIILAALNSPNFDYAYITPFLMDFDVMEVALSRGCSLNLVESLLFNKQFILKAIALRGWDVYLKLNKNLQEDPQIKLLAYKKRFLKKKCTLKELIALKKEYAELFSDEDMVLSLCEKVKESILLANSDLTDKQSFILKALKRNYLSIHEVKPDLIANLSFLKEACKINGHFLIAAKGSLFKDLELLEIAFNNEPSSIFQINLKELSKETLKEVLFKVPKIFPFLHLKYLDEEAIIEFLTLHGSYFLSLSEKEKKNKRYIKAASRHFPTILSSLNISDIIDDEELLYAYLSLKLPKSSVRFGGHSYVLLPFSNKLLTEKSHSPMQTGNWKLLIGKEESDLYQFIQNYTLQTAIVLEPDIDTEEKLQSRKEALFQMLELLDQRLTEKIPYLGTPTSEQSAELNLFYDSIYGYLNDLQGVLSQNSDLKIERLEILKAAGVCGGGLMAQLGELHDQLITIPSTHPVEKIAKKISESSIKKIASLNHNLDVHNTNQNRFILNDYVLNKQRLKDPLRNASVAYTTLCKFLQAQTPYKVVSEIKELFGIDTEIQDFIKLFCEDELFEGPHDLIEQRLTKEEIVSFLKPLEENKKTFLSLIPYVSENVELLMKIAQIAIQSGHQDHLVKLMQTVSQHRIDQQMALSILKNKKEISSMFFYFQKLIKFTGKSMGDLFTEEKGVLLDLLFLQQTEWTKQRLKGQFLAKDIDDDGNYLDAAYFKILTKLGFFKKI